MFSLRSDFNNFSEQILHMRQAAGPSHLPVRGFGPGSDLAIKLSDVGVERLQACGDHPGP
jgi:hypothetical protein